MFKKPLTSALICGIPLPILSGSHFTKKAVNNPKIANMINHAIIKKIFPLMNSKKFLKIFSDEYKRNRYKQTIIPAKIPTNIP